MASSRIRLHHVFFAVGVVFLFATIVYFSYEYVLNLSYLSKTIILICLVVAFFFTGIVLEERDI